MPPMRPLAGRLHPCDVFFGRMPMQPWSTADARRFPERLLDVLAHDIRGPLHNMRGWTTLLESGSLAPAQKAHAFAVIGRQVAVLAKLADDLEQLADRMSARGEAQELPELPASEEGREPPVPEEPAPPQGVLGGVLIMVVQHDADELMRLTGVLTRAGAFVEATMSATSALSCLRRLRPDVLLAALQLPEVDGWTLIRQVRNWPASQGGATPALALAAAIDPEEAGRSTREGFQEYLAGPFGQQELIAAVTRLVVR
jgi:CheY-like chemotaxis protein